MKRKLLALLCTATMFGTLFVGCGSSSSDGSTDSTSSDSSVSADETYSDITITVWCPSEAKDLTEAQLAQFNADNGTEIEFVVEAVGEGDAATNMITDVTAGADLYFFASDQLNRLIKAGALTQVVDSYEEQVTSENSAVSVEAVSASDGSIWAYPLTGENTFFVYYDTSVITEEEIMANQTDIIAACEAAGKNICFELTSSAWYSAAYFYATGCESTWSYDDEGTATDVTDTFNSDAGIIACKGMAELINSSVFVSSSDVSEFESGAAVVVSGSWYSTNAKEILGDNLGVCTLWSFTVDGEDYQLAPFNGVKLLGVKPQTDETKYGLCQIVAAYLAGEDCQLDRYESNGWYPSNTSAQEDAAVLADPVIQIAKETTETIAAAQGQYPNAWWDAGKVIGASIQELGTTSPSDDDLASILATYQNNVDNILSTTYKGWVITGSLDLNWDILGGDESGDGSGKYCLGEDNNTYDSYSSESPYVGIWEVEVEVCDEWGFRFCIYGEWTGGTYHTNGVGYSFLDTENSCACSEGSDNNIIPDDGLGTYIVTLDTTGDEPVVTVNLK